MRQVLNEHGVSQAEYSSISLIYPDLAVSQVGEADTWPSDNNAIVTFRYIDDHGIERINHSLVVDAKLGRIADSIDGQEKAADIYGRPISWVIYAFAQDVVTEEVPEPTDVPAGSPDRLYTLLEGETIWRVARRMGYTAEELAEHNDITPEQMFSVTEGYTLHLPESKTAPKQPQIRYEATKSLRPMHLKTAAQKWSFAGAKKLKHIKPYGTTYPEGHNVQIVGIAYVPVENDQEAGYYLDKNSFGTFTETGAVKYATGFQWSDLDDGYTDKPAPEPVVEAVIEEEPERIDPNIFKATYQPFEEGAVRYVPTHNIRVHDLDGERRPVKLWEKGRPVDIAGTFTKDDKLYGRPAGALKSGLWYGFLMSSIIEFEDEAEADPVYTIPEPQKNLADRLIVTPVGGLSGKIIYKLKIKKDK